MSRQGTRVVTPKNELVRFSYVNVFEKKSYEDGSEKYSIAILIPKENEETVAEVKAAIEAAIDAGVTSKFGGKRPKNLKTPLRDGDAEREDDENYEGMYFINASANRKPDIMDGQKPPQRIEDPEEFYSGCWGRVSINFFAFNTKGNKGVGAGLSNCQKLEDDDRLSGGASGASDFGDDDDSEFI